MTRWIIGFLVLGLASARAAPPEGGDGSLAPWYRSLQQPVTGAMCCSIADCRTVVTREDHGKLWAFIDGDFPNSPNNWEPVPEANILRRHDNPTGEVVACWYGGQVRCLVRASEG